jgi:hypothetical protein
VGAPSVPEPVAARIEEHIRLVIRSDDQAKRATRTAYQNMDGLLAGLLQNALPEVADAVSVRSGLDSDAAMSDVRGHLTDFRMILKGALGA